MEPQALEPRIVVTFGIDIGALLLEQNDVYGHRVIAACDDELAKRAGLSAYPEAGTARTPIEGADHASRPHAQDQAGVWETPRTLVLIGSALVAATAAIAGLAGYKFGQTPPVQVIFQSGAVIPDLKG